MEDREARLLLSPLRELEPDRPGAVDVERAVRHGRMANRNRVLGSALGVVVVVLAGALLVPSLREAPPAAGPGKFMEFSVLREEFSVGAAAGYRPLAYTTGRTRQVAVLASADKSATVVFYAKGSPPLGGVNWPPRDDPAPPVFGRAAYYVYGVITPGHAELAWQWEPGGWAVVDLPGGTPDVFANARAIAAHTGSRYQGQVRTPFTVADPPHGWGLLGVQTSFPREPAMPRVALLLGDTAETGDPEQLARVQVQVSTEPGPKVLGQGLYAEVSGAAPAAEQQQVLDGVRLSVGPDPTDIAHWATNPIR